MIESLIKPRGSKKMNRKLVEIIAHAILFLEFADEATVNPDAVVRQLEDVAFGLGQLSISERKEFISILQEIAKDHPVEKERAYLMELPVKLLRTYLASYFCSNWDRRDFGRLTGLAS